METAAIRKVILTIVAIGLLTMGAGYALAASETVISAPAANFSRGAIGRHAAKGMVKVERTIPFDSPVRAKRALR